MVGPFIFFDQMGPAEFLLGAGIGLGRPEGAQGDLCLAKPQLGLAQEVRIGG